MSNSPRNQTIEEHGSVDAYFKNTLGTKDWSRDVESYVADTSFSSDFEHPILPGASSAVLDLAGRNVPCRSFRARTPELYKEEWCNMV